MAGDFEFKVVGYEDLRAALEGLAPELRRRALANALRAGARVMRDAMKPLTPVLAKAKYRRGVLIRKPGTVRDAITVRTSKDTNRTGDVGVFVNVKPAPPGRRGAYSPHDPFYWHWIHFSSIHNQPRKEFLLDGFQRSKNAALTVIEEKLGDSIQRMNSKL